MALVGKTLKSEVKRFVEVNIVRKWQQLEHRYILNPNLESIYITFYFEMIIDSHAVVSTFLKALGTVPRTQKPTQ